MIVSIVVTYNGIKWITKCLDSLLCSTKHTKIIVVDNASSDNTVKCIKEKYLDIRVIESCENLGFARANNIGIRNALNEGAEYVFLLNQDAWIEPDTIEKLLSVFENKPDAGIVSPIHLNGSHTGLDIQFSGYIGKDITPNLVSDLYFGKLQKCYKTNFVNAAAWLVSKKCIEIVGGFDTFLFVHYGEDANYCQRALYHGFNIFINTQTTICHDREERNGKHTEVFEKKNERLSQTNYYANPFLSDEKIYKHIDSLKIIYRRKVIKYCILLNFKALKQIKKYIKDELEYFNSIAKSRNEYKTGKMSFMDQKQS